VVALKKYNLQGQEIGEVAIEDELLKSDANLQMIKDYLIAQRANARQWSANTKKRCEVNHSGQKPHPQKGTGRARQGYLGAPQYKGGGRVHGPRPKFDQHVHVNKKEKKAAIRHLLAEKIRASRLHVLKDEAMKKPKTKSVAGFLKMLNLTGKRVLFLGGAESEAETFFKSMRNIPRAEMMQLKNAGGYDLALSGDIIVMEPAMKELMAILTV
jgi:large subunit ribosomal protein L4